MRKQQMRHRLPWLVCVWCVRGYCRAPDTLNSKLEYNLSQHSSLISYCSEFTFLFSNNFLSLYFRMLMSNAWNNRINSILNEATSEIDQRGYAIYSHILTYIVFVHVCKYEEMFCNTKHVLCSIKIYISSLKSSQGRRSCTLTFGCGQEPFMCSLFPQVNKLFKK